MSKVVVSGEVVCEFPYKGFNPIRKAEGIGLFGSFASGKTQRLFDIGAQFVLEGKFIGIISDELTPDEVANKLEDAMVTTLTAQGVEGIDVKERMQKRVVIFNSFDSFKRMLDEEDEVIPNLGAVLCDTEYTIGLQGQETHTEFVERQLSVLGGVQERFGVVTVYTSHISLSLDKDSGDVNKPFKQDFSRLFNLQKVEGRCNVTEVTNSGEVLVSTVVTY